MATYYTDFSEHTTGQPPSDWTTRFFGSGATHTVLADAQATGGKVLQIAKTSNNRQVFSWDDIDGDVNRDDVEVAFKSRITAVSTLINIQAYVRASGSSGSETGYRLGLATSSTASEVGIGKHVSGASQEFADITVASVVVNTWYWTRARVNGTNLRLRFWQDGSPEPSAWDVETTDSDILAAGFVGLYMFFAGTTAEFDVFAVGTNGDDAPAPIVAGGGNVDETVTEGIDLGYQLGFAATLEFPDDKILLGDSFEAVTPSAEQEDLDEGIVLGDSFSPFVSSTPTAQQTDGIVLGDSFIVNLITPRTFEDAIEFDAYITREVLFDLEL